MRIAVYGASGYQAKLILTELSQQDIDVVLTGRDAGRLRQAATTVGLTSRRSSTRSPTRPNTPASPSFPPPTTAACREI